MRPARSERRLPAWQRHNRQRPGGALRPLPSSNTARLGTRGRPWHALSAAWSAGKAGGSAPLFADRTRGLSDPPRTFQRTVATQGHRPMAPAGPEGPAAPGRPCSAAPPASLLLFPPLLIVRSAMLRPSAGWPGGNAEVVLRAELPSCGRPSASGGPPCPFTPA